MSICYKQLNNIDGSSLVTFNGKTSFEQIDSLQANQASLDGLQVSNTIGGNAQYSAVSSVDIAASNIITSPAIETDILKWRSSSYLGQHYVGFKAGSLNETTVYTLPLQDGTKGQVLSTDGMANLSFSSIDIADLPVLGAALFPLPSLSTAIPMPNPTFNPTSPLAYTMSSPWLPQILAGSVETSLTPVPHPINPETVISSTLAMTQINVAQAIKRLDNAGFIVKSKTIDYSWENPIYSFVTDPLLIAAMKLYNLDTTYTFPDAQALDELEAGLLKQENGVIAIAAPNVDYLSLELTENNIWLGNAENKAVMTPYNAPAPLDATYILQTPKVGLPNAQALSSLSTLFSKSGILKSDESGVISYAKGGVIPVVDDYVTPISLQVEIASAIESVIEAAVTAAVTAATAEIFVQLNLIPTINYTPTLLPPMADALDIGGFIDLVSSHPYRDSGIGTGVMYCEQNMNELAPEKSQADLSTVDGVLSVTLETSSRGITIVNGRTEKKYRLYDIHTEINLNRELEELSQIKTNGFICRHDIQPGISSPIYESRNIEGSTNITVTNGDGVVGNPTVNLSDNIKVLAVKLLTKKDDKVFTTSLQSSSNITADTSFILPPNNGVKGQLLTTDGIGNTSWANNSGSILDGGIATLNGIIGVVIKTTAIMLTSIVNITRNLGTSGMSSVITVGNLIVGSIIEGESFTVYSTVANDSGNFNWSIINA